MKQKITPFLWFEKEAGDAARFYESVFKDAEITNESIMENTPSGTVEIYTVKLLGQAFTLMSAGPFMKINAAISFVIDCKDQEEVDYYWDKLSAVPEAEQCGWCTDKFGVTWQVVPSVLDEYLSDPDKEKVARVTQAFLQMKKFDIAGLDAAYKGE
jgi:predicted 3-demethylubiquinone-9 3-methyltransferase (glyoxalase superfamily)